MADPAEFTPLNPEDFEVMKGSAVLHVMRFSDGRACVIERNPNGSNYDVKARFYHSYFGGREAWVQDGKFGCVVHTD